MIKLLYEVYKIVPNEGKKCVLSYLRTSSIGVQHLLCLFNVNGLIQESHCLLEPPPPGGPQANIAHYILYMRTHVNKWAHAHEHIRQQRTGGLAAVCTFLHPVG